MKKDTQPDTNIIIAYFKSHPKDLWLSVLVCVLCLLIFSTPRFMVKDVRIQITSLPKRSGIQSGNMTTNKGQTFPKSRSPNSTFSDKKRKHGLSESKVEVVAEDTRALSMPSSIDPNEASFETLRSLGVPSRVASNWSKYTIAGGRINQHEDLEKIYGMTPELLNTLRGRFQYPPDTVSAAGYVSRKRLSNVRVNINQASAEEWQSIHGIGPVLSQRIVKFRDALGGFYSIDQVGDTYGVSDSLFQVISHHLNMENRHDSLFINQISESELSSHPYVTYKEARIIQLYKKEHGPYLERKDLLATGVIDSNWLKKMTPYLSLSR